jgi:hypothetical protein
LVAGLAFGSGQSRWRKRARRTAQLLIIRATASAVDHPSYRLGKDMRDRKDNRLCCHDKSGVLSGLARVVWS